MRIGLLSQYYEPEDGPAALAGLLARGLASRGHEVHVLTGFPNYPAGRLVDGYRMARRLDEQIDGVHVRRVALYPSHDRSALRRSVTYGSFAVSALVSGVRALRGLDVMWVSNSPITLALPMWFMRYAQSTPVVLHVLDLWPDVVADSGVVRSAPGYKVLERTMHVWCRAMYSAASRVAYISPSMGKLLASRGVADEKLAYIPLWGDESAARAHAGDLRRELGIDRDQIVLLYGGSLGETIGLESLVDACALIDHPQFVCLVSGSGIAEESLRARARRHGATNLRFLGRLPKEQVPALLNTGDIHYVSLRTSSASAQYSLPSKVQATLAAGRPMLVSGDGDLAQVARDSGAGIVVPPGHVDSLVARIRQIIKLGREGLGGLGAQGRKYYERTFSVNRGIERVESALWAASEDGRYRRYRNTTGKGGS